MPLAKADTVEIRFPSLGVRRSEVQERAASAVSYPSVWGCNVRLEDALDRRQRGGSRTGLEKFVPDKLGTTIADMANMNVSSAGSGASEILVVLVDSTIKTVENGSVTAYGAAPASGFFVTGRHNAYVITTSSIVKVNPQTGSITNLAATAGTIPSSCTFGAIYRDRMCLSGDDNTIYMSKQGDYTNWHFGVDLSNNARAVAFQLSLSSDIGALPTALIPVRDSYLLAASSKSLWVLRGDPTTGQLIRVSENIGIISSRSWCRIDNQVYFLSEGGLYRVSADGSDLNLVSGDIPKELSDIDPATVTVRMGYSHDREDITVFLRTSAGSDIHWMYEIDHKAWWPVQFADSNHSPLAVAQHSGGVLLLAGADGYVRTWSTDSGSDDDGIDISSHVVLGPIRLSQAGYHGIARSLHTVLGQESGVVNWRFVTGETADEASDRAKLAIEAFQAGTDYSEYVRASGSVGSGGSAGSGGSTVEVGFDSVNANHGTLTGGAAQSTDIPAVLTGKSLSLDGTDDYVRISNPTAINFGTGVFSLSFWLKVAATPSGDKGLIVKDSYAGSGNGIYVYLANGQNRLAYWNGVTAEWTAATVVDNTWHHVAIVREGTGAGQLKIYVDGVLDQLYGNRYLTASEARTLSNSTDLTIGSIGAGYYVAGKLDDVRVYNVAKNASQIAALAAGTDDQTGSVGQWKFDGLSQSVPSGSGRSSWAYPRVRAMWLCIWLESSDQWAFESLILERAADAGRWRRF